MRDRCDSYDILLFLILHERDAGSNLMSRSA